MKLEARKENKVYQIDETQKDRYLKEGFDIYEDGKINEYTPLKKIPYSEHLKVVKELKARFENVKDVTELLKNYAELKGVDVGSSTSATGILDKILKSEKNEE